MPFITYFKLRVQIGGSTQISLNLPTGCFRQRVCRYANEGMQWNSMRIHDGILDLLNHFLEIQMRMAIDFLHHHQKFLITAGD